MKPIRGSWPGKGVREGQSLRFLVIGLVSLVLANPAPAQGPVLPIDTPPLPQPLPAPPPPQPVDSASTPSILKDASVDPDSSIPCMWGGVEYLLWWVKSGPTVPLVTTGNPADAVPGALGQPGTQVFFGNSPFNYGSFNGMRFNLDCWLDENSDFGLDSSGFVLQQRGVGFNAGSNYAGNPPLYVPFFNVQTGQEGSLAIADPLAGVNGTIAVTSSTQLWGFDVNTFTRLKCGESFYTDLLLGFRYIDLRESLDIAGSYNQLALNVQNVYTESFDTRNQFYGGQLGTRFGYRKGRLTAELTGKLALGSMQEMVNLNGTFTQTGPGSLINGTLPQGGVFVQPTNIGPQDKPVFSLLPSFQARTGFDIFSCLRVTAGYDFLYLTNAVRPGDQIDRNVNPSQFASGGALTGPAFPQQILHRSDFFATGVSFGLEVRW